MSLDIRDEGGRLLSQAKPFAEAHQNTQPSFFVPKKPYASIRLHGSGLRLAEVMQQPDQLEDRRFGDAGLDLPFKPLVQPSMIIGKELPKISQQQFD
jgi:hypothetical protein